MEKLVPIIHENINILPTTNTSLTSSADEVVRFGELSNKTKRILIQYWFVSAIHRTLDLIIISIHEWNILSFLLFNYSLKYLTQN